MSVIDKTIESVRIHAATLGMRGLYRRAMVGLGGNSEFWAPIPGSDKKVLVRLGTTDVAAFEDVFLRGEYQQPLPGTPNVVVDAGANVGMSSVYFALKYPLARIIAVEPEPTNFEILAKNAARFPQITAVHAAIWCNDGTVQISDPGKGKWGMRVTTGSGASIRAITMPTLMKDYHLRRIDLLKMDVEGAECEILQNAEGWMSHVATICVELHDRLRPGCSDAFEVATADFPKRWKEGPVNWAARGSAV